MFKRISFHALYASVDFSDTFSVVKRITVLALIFAIFAEKYFQQVKICLHSFASKPDGLWQPCVSKAAFLAAESVGCFCSNDSYTVFPLILTFGNDIDND